MAPGPRTFCPQPALHPHTQLVTLPHGEAASLCKPLPLLKATKVTARGCQAEHSESCLAGLAAQPSPPPPGPGQLAEHPFQNQNPHCGVSSPPR